MTSNMYNKKVSIILPIFNTETYLQRCLNSILEQDYNNFELICIDDKSTDNSLNILKDFAGKHTTLDIKILSNETNKGQAYCRNIGIKKSIGEYIAFIDSDDFISPNFLSDMTSTIQSNNADIVMCKLTSQNKKTHNFHSSLNPTGTFTTFEEKFNLISNGSCCDKLFNAKIIKNNNIKFPENCFYEDNEFLAKAMYFSNKICTTNNSSYYYCYNFSSITRATDNKKKLKLSASKILEDIFTFFKDKNLTAKEKAILIQFCKSFCSHYVEDDDFEIPKHLNRNNFIKLILKPKYKNIFQRIFSIVNTSSKTKVLTILFIPIKLNRKFNMGAVK